MRARNAASPAAPGSDATPNPFAPLAWPPPPVDGPPIGAPLVAPPAAAPLVAPPAAAVEARFVERPPEATLHVHEPAPTAPVAPTASHTPVSGAPAATAPAEEPPAPQPDTRPIAPPEPQSSASAPPAPPAPAAETPPEMLRLFEVVTNMCDHVIEYIETDRAERRVMLETLATLGRALTESAAALALRTATAIEAAETRLIEHPEPRERVVGGSMPAGPEPVIDLRSTAPAAPAPVATPVGHRRDDPTPAVAAAPSAPPAPVAPTTTVMTTEIAVEVRGRFGDRWVDGFEICEVMETPEGHRYRLRRHRDGVILPELFDATSIRHVETFDQLATNGAHVQRGNGRHNGRDASVDDANVTDATGYVGPSVNGAAHWSRS